MAAVRIGGLLEQAVERFGVGNQVRAARVVTKANQILQEMFGGDSGNYMRVVSYRHGEVVCVAESSAAGMAIRQREQELLEGIKKHFPHLRFDRVQLRTNG